MLGGHELVASVIRARGGQLTVDGAAQRLIQVQTSFRSASQPSRLTHLLLKTLPIITTHAVASLRFQYQV